MTNDKGGPEISEQPEGSEGLRAAAAQKRSEKGLNKSLVTGVAVGVGSAALVAALLYANRTRKG